ncbi:MAG: carbohydrate kinase [Marinosulfonomonas sp.]|nr:MAG: carbohydrate kinase [Marinosulfonomonas sp.]
MPKILCCGEALIDMLPSDGGFMPACGGAAFNTAIALGRLGASVGFFSGLSSDFFGDMLRGSLQASGVDSRLAITSARPCTLAFVRLVEGHAQYAFYDEGTAGRMLDAGDIPALPDTVQALFFGGISLVSEPCATAYEALMMREAPARVTMIDPNIRPGFIADEASYRARIERMLALADIIKLSDEDLHWLRGAGDLADLAQAFLAAGAKLVLITEGAKGATAYSTNHKVFMPATKADVIDAVGAGDTFNAGILAALHQLDMLTKETLDTIDDAALTTALTLATRAAAITVSRSGANPPWAKDLT